VTAAAASAGPQPSVPGATIEYQHAINYLTKIKRRFANDPASYKSFLEVLHTSDKQQISRKEVLDRVSVLFKDHPDLLRDFTYFLPDAVQETDKQRMMRPGQQAGVAAGHGAASGKPRGGGTIGRPQPGGARAGVLGKDFDKKRLADRDHERDADERISEDRRLAGGEREKEKERLVDRARDRATVGMAAGKSARLMAVSSKVRREREELLHVTLTPTERVFFNRVKAVLGGGEAWVEFLKALDLYAMDIVTRPELLGLLQDLFGPSNSRMLEELRSLLHNRGQLEFTQEDLWYSMPIGEIDFSSCPRCTPSYRALPTGYPKLSCSERSKSEAAALNDVWISIPTGSEDFSFKIMRKNIYEDALFRCEDERYEIDMVIDNNMSAICALEPLAAEINALKSTISLQSASNPVEWQLRLDRRSLGIIQLKAISRVYGEYGADALDLLRRNPAAAIPIFLHRLKQKDLEWRSIRSELNKNWRDAMEKNYYKSLDHRSFYFKQADKKATTSKALVMEMKHKVEVLETTIREYVSVITNSVGETERSNTISSAAAMDVDGDEKKPAKGVSKEVKELMKEASAPSSSAGSSSMASSSSSTSAEVPLASALPSDIRSKLLSLAPVLHFMYRDVSIQRDVAALISYAVVNI
jgi:paired amphipathic helix protein Sin3a